ncbi:MAG: hypothetical protein OXG15_09570 [Gammaproteobacteria bacterium]|nr:hypothetical protein [Gammaproteobacteria bacterium]
MIASCFAFVSISIAAQQTVGTSQPAPKLLDAISDQTLFLNPVYVEAAGSVASQRIYLRDLHLSFGESTDQKFSAYPYNKSVADAWVVENFLIVLAKSVGSAQVAVTASNEFGSMIDWFIVHVEERKETERSNQAKAVFQSEFLTAPISFKSEITLRLPELTTGSAKYLIAPDLPSGLVYDELNKSIRGRPEGGIPSSTYYWIGVSDLGAGIQQFTFAPHQEREVEAATSSVSTPVLSFEESLPPTITVDSASFVDHRSSTSPRATPTGSVAASRPFRPESSDISTHQNLLHGVTSAMHSRFRDVSLRQAGSEPSTYTLWNYASTRYSANSSRPGIEPSGIYVGFDTKLVENITTGLTISFDSQGFTNTSLRNSNRTHDLAGANLASILPYARWHDGSGAEIWGVVGLARDLSEFDGTNAPNSDLRSRNLLLGAVGWRQLLGSTGSVQLATVGDAGLTIPLRSGAIDSDQGLLTYIGSRSLSAGLEMSFSGEQVQPYVGLSGRINSSPETRDTSLEALGGVRYTSLSGLTFEAEGRALSAQDVFEDPELVFSVAAHLDPGLRGEGLALSVSPMYGVNRSQGFLTPDSAFRYSHYGDERFTTSHQNAWAMSGSLSYGVPVGGTGVITPFGQIAISTLNQTRMGVRVALNSSLDRLFNLEIATVQSRFDQQEFDKGVDIQLRLVF